MMMMTMKIPGSRMMRQYDDDDNEDTWLQDDEPTRCHCSLDLAKLLLSTPAHQTQHTNALPAETCLTTPTIT